MCHKADPVLFARLGALDAGDVERRSLCRYDAERGEYVLPFLLWEYRVSPERRSIVPAAEGAREVSADMAVLFLFYLLSAKEEPLGGAWVSEFDLPGGAMFFRGPHRFRNDAVAARFGRDIEGFERACLSLGGERAELGDRAFTFKVLPRVPAAVVLWRADEEFEASSKLLMDSSIRAHLPLDVIFGLSLELLGAIVGKPLWG